MNDKDRKAFRRRNKIRHRLIVIKMDRGYLPKRQRMQMARIHEHMNRIEMHDMRKAFERMNRMLRESDAVAKNIQRTLERMTESARQHADELQRMVDGNG